MCIWSESVFDLAINCHDCTTKSLGDDDNEEDEDENYSNSRVLVGGSDLTRIIQS